MKSKLSQIDCERVILLYQQGKTLKEIGLVFDVNQVTIGRTLRKSGIDTNPTQEPLPLPDNTVLAYLAGFFDGEGCVYIVKGRKGTKVQYSLELSYTNSEIEPLELAQSVFGGQISSLNETRLGRKSVHRLRIRSNQAASALSLLLPYLRVKRKRAEIALEFQAKIQGYNGNTRNLSVEECEKYKAAITSLNDKVWNQSKAVL